MKSFLHFAAALGLLVLTPVLAGAEAVASKADIARLTGLGCEMGRAYARQDFAELDRLNAEDYTQTDTRGIAVARSDYPEYVRQRTAEYVENGASTLSIDCDNIEVRLYGDAAVVIGEWTYTVRKPEGDTRRRSRWTSMWTRYPVGWKRHAFQNTWVNSDANQPPTGAATTQGRQASPELYRAIEALSGSWSVSEEYPPSALYPKGGVGRGTEVWRAGPGNIDLVYEYHSTNPNGEMWATALLWWDSEAKRLRELWCSGQNQNGCMLSSADIHWVGSQLVFSDSYEVKGQRLFTREVWSQMESGAHTMTISESTTNSDFKPWIVSHAVRRK